MTHHLFISHSWAYSDTYDGLVKLLDAAPRFEYRNFSVPKDDPILKAPTDTALKAAIAQQMALSSVVIVLAGVYATYSKWINIEIELAQTGFVKNKKPIIAVQPWAAERTSIAVKNAADRIVGWNTNSIVSAIRELNV